MLMKKSPEYFPGANGVLVLPLSWPMLGDPLMIHGGPYDRFKRITPDAVGICVRAERTGGKEIDAHVPIIDFQTPTQDMIPAFEIALRTAMGAALRGKPVYVGCMGGMGRTGLFLAILAKASDIENPVEFVREHYFNHAVETPDQYAFVMDYDTTAIRRWLIIESWYVWAQGLPFIGRFLG